MKKSRIILTILSIMLILSMAVNLTSCMNTTIHAQDLMKDTRPREVDGKEIDDAFIMSQTEFALKLFKATALESENKNLLISPLSIQLALAMTANGADGETLAEMEKLLGGDIPIETLNEYLYSYVKILESNQKAKLNIANSIWFRDTEDLQVSKDFLQTNADYYGAAAYKAPMDKRTVKDINNWVKNNTDGMIEKVIDEIDPQTVMFLINTLLFDAEWQNPYTEYAVKDAEFTAISGEKRIVELMYSDENRYLSSENAVGFIKPYSSNYAFAAILPNEETNVYEYIDALDAEDLQALLESSKSTTVKACLPKFSYNYDVYMNGILTDLGMGKAFGPVADFSKLGKSENGNIFISRVLHSASITVGEKGTKAGAATVVTNTDSAPEEIYYVTLDRPFIYMIIDSENNLPIFMGIVTDIQK